MSWIRKLTPLVFLAVAGLFFYLLLSTSFNEADDVVNLHFVLSHSYTTLLNIPFMDDQNAIMFRPGLAVIQKALQTFSKSHWMALRVFQVTLTSSYDLHFFKEKKI
jgi:hypothetical protein